MTELIRRVLNVALLLLVIVSGAVGPALSGHADPGPSVSTRPERNALHKQGLENGGAALALGEAQSQSEERWLQAQSRSFQYFYLPESRSAEELRRITLLAEDSLRHVEAVLEHEYSGRLQLYLVNRIFWQGGAAYGQGTFLVSYLRRNYVGVSLSAYLRHEITHVVSGELAGERSSSGGLLGEGLSVYVTGGHYRLGEDLHRRAAALLEGDLYVPLTRLRHDFHGAQHETAYAEAGSFVGFLIEKYGWTVFKRLYRRPDAARQIYGKGYDDLEAEWLRFLRERGVTDAEVQREKVFVGYYDTMRRYQEVLDPPARILPDRPDKWDQTTFEHMVTKPQGEVQVAVELMLMTAGQAMDRADFARAQTLLDEIASVVEAEGRVDGGLAQQYLAVVRGLNAHKHTPQIADLAVIRQTATRTDERFFADRCRGPLLAPAGQPDLVFERPQPHRIELNDGRAWVWLTQSVEAQGSSSSERKDPIQPVRWRERYLVLMLQRGDEWIPVRCVSLVERQEFHVA